jgi:probable addiction module antidote protein
MALETKPFDAAKHFRTDEAQARLLNDALGSGDAGYVANALGVIARARGMSEIAQETGLSRTALYASFSENGNPSLDTILRVTKALGLALHASAAPTYPKTESA